MKKITLLTMLAIAPFVWTGCDEKSVPAEGAGQENQEIQEIPEIPENSEKSVPAEQKSVPADDAVAHPFLVHSAFIPWSQLTPDKIVPDTREAIARAQAAIDKICAVPEENLTYENTVQAYDDAFETFDFFCGVLGNCESTCMSPEFREQYAIALPMTTEFTANLALNEALYKQLKAFSLTEEANRLTPVQTRHLKQMLDGFVDGGIELPADKKAELKAIISELTTITQKFSQNVLDATNSWKKLITDKSQLAGLPEADIASAFEAAKKENLATDDAPVWLFTLQAPSYMAAIKYLDSAELRKEIFLAYNDICAAGTPFDNSEIMKRVIELRQQEAELLGFKNFSDLILKNRMAKNGGNAMAFVDELAAKTKPAFDREYQKLKEFRASVDPNFDAGTMELEPWDTSYWSEKFRQAEYDFDANLAKPYFESNNVIAGMFDFFGELYDVSFKELDVKFQPLGSAPVPAGTIEVWHPEVRCFSLIDNKLGRPIAIFYFDLFPRKSKRSGAWMHPFIAANHDNGELSMALVCGNMTAPAGDGKALWTHYDVETLYHEFGHNLHQLFGNVPVRALNGTSVAWDFVEFPSQLNENWTWEPEILARWAKHHKTGEPIPADLVAKMVRARNFQAAYQQMRQLSFAKGDLFIHQNVAALKGKDLDAEIAKETADYLWPFASPQHTIFNRLTHVFRDHVAYASGYYSYKWAEALEADAFQSFKNPDGTLNLARGADYRRCILEQGDSRDAIELFRAFVGRDPDWNAINVLYGIVDGNADGNEKTGETAEKAESVPAAQ